MAKRQEMLKAIAHKKFGVFKHDKLTLRELENSKLVPVVYEVYKKLGGQLESLPYKYGPWDITTKELIIELDEERHFNRYRLETLKLNYYNSHKHFSVIDYRSYCSNFESNCLFAASWGRYWKNDSTEKMFIKSNEDGNLLGNGSSRWRQRAFYDFMKDITSTIKGIPILRISIYDEFQGKTINNILNNNDIKTLNDLFNEIGKKR